MPEIVVQNLGDLRVKVTESQTVLQALQANGQDWMHACGAKGRCTTCRMIILTGQENLAPETPAELKFRASGRLKPNERLTCQTLLTTGPVLCRVPEQTKLPHLSYSD